MTMQPHKGLRILALTPCTSGGKPWRTDAHAVPGMAMRQAALEYLGYYPPSIDDAAFTGRVWHSRWYW